VEGGERTGAWTAAVVLHVDDEVPPSLWRCGPSRRESTATRTQSGQDRRPWRKIAPRAAIEIDRPLPPKKRSGITFKGNRGQNRRKRMLVYRRRGSRSLHRIESIPHARRRQ
jgi:hypothetical protein